MKLMTFRDGFGLYRPFYGGHLIDNINHDDRLDIF